MYVSLITLTSDASNLLNLGCPGGTKNKVLQLYSTEFLFCFKNCQTQISDSFYNIH